MSVNIAARRGARNQRRKAAVAEKRKAEPQLSGIAGQGASPRPIRSSIA